MRQRAERAIEECRLFATMTEEPGRITRRFLTAPVKEVHAHLRRRMEGLGMEVQLDNAGNLRGVLPSSNRDGKRLILGSHIDTVPDAGAYDGVLGVTIALEIAEIAKERQLPFALEVIAFSEEEGARFGVPCLGSRAAAGRFDHALLALRDEEGTTLEDAICNFGLDPARIDDAAVSSDALGYFEVHIEQGPVLEAEDLSVAAVTGIVGQSRLTLTFAGSANHAGTTPMNLRHDALAAAAEWIGKVEEVAHSSDGLVATVGRIVPTPNAGNVIAGRAQMSLDVRHMDDRVRAAAVKNLLEKAEAIADRRGLALQHTEQLDQPAVPLDERLTAFLTESMEAEGFQPKRMTSGAGHDAMVMAGRMPATMLFLRSPGGVSHNPAETVREEDVEAALKVCAKFLERLAAEVR